MAKRGRDQISFRKVEHQDGRFTLYARFWAPEKQTDGEIIWRRCERSTGTGDERKAQKIAERLREEERQRGYAEKPKEKSGRTFNDAATSYMKAGNDGSYLVPILERIGTKPIHSITQEVIQGLADEIYPGRAPATLNRQVFTPIVAVLRFVEGPDFRAPRVNRPKGWLPKSNFKRPPKDWWARVLPHCPANLEAFILFVRLHGRRTSEACSLRAGDIDGDTWRVSFRDTKEDQEISFVLAKPVIDALAKYPWRLNARVFGYQNRWSIYKPLRRACEAAGVPYHVPKDAGRHSMATYMLEQGMTLKEVKEAGRWKSIKMPDRIYGHLENHKVDADVRELGEQWHGDMGEKGEVLRPEFGAKLGERNCG